MNLNSKHNVSTQICSFPHIVLCCPKFSSLAHSHAKCSTSGARHILNNSPKQPGCLQLRELSGVNTLFSTVAWGAFVVCITLSSAPWCFEHCGIGRWSVVLKSQICRCPGRDKSVCWWCLPSVTTLYWWGPLVRNSQVVYVLKFLQSPISHSFLIFANHPKCVNDKVHLFGIHAPEWDHKVDTTTDIITQCWWATASMRRNKLEV